MVHMLLVLINNKKNRDLVRNQFVFAPDLNLHAAKWQLV